MQNFWCITHGCVDGSAGQINSEFMEGIADDKKNNMILGNWPYFELQTMIEQKAKQYNIKVKKVDPYHLSQTCSVCGNYEPGQRLEQKNFICKNEDCKNHGKIVNADYNASQNIARSTKYMTKKDQSEFIKKKEAKDEELIQEELVET